MPSKKKWSKLLLEKCGEKVSTKMIFGKSLCHLQKALFDLNYFSEIV